jgi:hypothetical protein
VYPKVDVMTRPPIVKLLPVRTLALLVLCALLLPALPTAVADDTGRSFTREDTGRCGDWPQSLYPHGCYTRSEATLTVTDCDSDHCDFTLSQSGNGTAAAPGLMFFDLIYMRADDADGSRTTVRFCSEFDEVEALSESLDPQDFSCPYVCHAGYAVAQALGCSGTIKDRAHIPPGYCSWILDGAQFEDDFIEVAQTDPTFRICRDASGAVTVF